MSSCVRVIDPLIFRVESRGCFFLTFEWVVFQLRRPTAWECQADVFRNVATTPSEGQEETSITRDSTRKIVLQQGETHVHSFRLMITFGEVWIFARCVSISSVFDSSSISSFYQATDISFNIIQYWSFGWGCFISNNILATYNA